MIIDSSEWNADRLPCVHLSRDNAPREGLHPSALRELRHTKARVVRGRPEDTVFPASGVPVGPYITRHREPLCAAKPTLIEVVEVPISVARAAVTSTPAC